MRNDSDNKANSYVGQRHLNEKGAFELAKKLTYEYVFNYFKSNDCVLLSQEYLDSKSPLKYICSCGEPSEIVFNKFRIGQRCRKCKAFKISKKLKIDFSEVAKEFNKRGHTLLDENYVSSTTPLYFRCSKGHTGKISLDNLKRGKGCKRCAIEKRAQTDRHDYDFVKKFFEEVGCTLTSNSYDNQLQKLEFVCKCGKKGVRSFNKFRIRPYCLACGHQKLLGKNNHNYNPELTDDERVLKRKFKEYDTWRSDVFSRDDYTCVVCSSKGGRLNAHHLDGYGWCKEKRTDVANGVTLCEECHTEFHGLYGYGDNTKRQFSDWLTVKHDKDAI